MTFADWAEARDVAVNPEGRAPNLIANHLNFIIDALIDLQQKVPCLRGNHTNRIEFSSTFWDCGFTVADAPRGFISKVYTTDSNLCNRVHYSPKTKEQAECLMLESKVCTEIVRPYGAYYDDGEGAYVDYPELENGLEYSEGTTDKVSRACSGSVVLEDGSLWLWPSIQSTEIIWVKWHGVKRDYESTDIVDFDRSVNSAVENYLRAQIARTELFDPQIMATALNTYTDQVAMMIWECRKENRLPSTLNCMNNSGCSSLVGCS